MNQMVPVDQVVLDFPSIFAIPYLQLLVVHLFFILIYHMKYARFFKSHLMILALNTNITSICIIDLLRTATSV